MWKATRAPVKPQLTDSKRIVHRRSSTISYLGHRGDCTASGARSLKHQAHSQCPTDDETSGLPVWGEAGAVLVSGGEVGETMREPDISGSHGKAWKVKVSPPQDETTIEAYLVSVYGAHPLWNYWLVSTIHLRDVPGMPPAIKDYPAATHEFLILTINPESCPPDPDNFRVKYLLPVDVQIQFDGLDDEQARSLCVSAVTAIADGQISPDQDYRFAWRRLIKEKVRSPS